MKSRLGCIVLSLLLVACDMPAIKPKAPEVKPTVRLTLLPQDSYTVGKPMTILAKINNIEERKVLTDAELDTVHTMKFHLLVIDPTFTDYQHIHPQATATRGVYSFQFTPKSASGYRAWADVTPTKTHKQEFAMSEIGSPRKADIDKSVTTSANVSGYHFTLAFDKAPAVGDESMGTISVTDTSGKAVTNFEPVMGASAHIVGFYEDYRTVVHTHPMEGAELMFHLSPTKPGFIKLFAQIKIGGRELFVPFGVVVAKGS